MAIRSPKALESESGGYAALATRPRRDERASVAFHPYRGDWFGIDWFIFAEAFMISACMIGMRSAM